MSYCLYIQTGAGTSKEIHKTYHDQHYGFPIHDDNELFGRLLMEINQAGLSWETILKKEATFRQAYDNFDIAKIAAYTQADRERLLADPGIIRNRLKVEAAIHNARVIQQLRDTHGGFAAWLDAHHPLPKAEWVKLFKKTFRFTGGEITGEFLMSLGYLPGAHRQDCPAYRRAAQQRPPWMAAAGH